LRSLRGARQQARLDTSDLPSATIAARRQERRLHLRLKLRGLRPTCVPAAVPDDDLHQALHDRNVLARLGRRLRRRPWRPGVRHWLRRIRPALPPHPPICAETPRTTQGVSQVLKLGFRRRLRGRWPRLGVRPASGHVGL